ncbi:MAG: hypothetical protein J3Q66DRAFT_395685 [Benniella sp.]|nr:MAG: hypothetical protein J3Q66DRAFT_395685 [Benniella sp.]
MDPITQCNFGQHPVTSIMLALQRKHVGPWTFEAFRNFYREGPYPPQSVSSHAQMDSTQTDPTQKDSETDKILQAWSSDDTATLGNTDRKRDLNDYDVSLEWDDYDVSQEWVDDRTLHSG